MMKKYLFLCITALFFINGSSIAQDRVVEKPFIKVISKVNSNEVKLRWAISSPSAWKRANKYGYIVERFTIKRNGQQLNTAEKKVLTAIPIVPKPLEEWKSIVEQNDYAAVLAQSLYGETFQVEQIQGGLAQIVNQAKEIEQRFSFALYAADLNYEAALLGGLAYVDTDINENEEYFYTVRTVVPIELLEVEAGNVYVNPAKKEELPQPIDLIAIGDDKNILLTWEYEMFKTVFTSYYLERSENGTDFKRLGDTPLVNLNDKPGSPSKRMFYIDTISQNNKTYYYRVKGISPFGEQSPSSEIASAQGIKKLAAVPHISNYKFDKIGGVDILWEFPKEAEKQITKFELNWAPQEKGPYTVVKTDIPVSSRKTNYKELNPSNYFKITAVGKGNQKTTSLTAFVQTIDSIPPSAPLGVEGVVDTLGIVNLKWKANTEKDMLGYRVFRGNLENEEVSQLTVSPIETNTFTDTVQIKSLNSKVYYQIVAVDQRFNMSDFSEKLALKKPDVVPPSSPIFSKYKVIEDGVFLQWINSSSDDVVSHQLFRQKVAEADKGWQLVYKTDTISKFIDHEALPDIKYRYAIFAEDDSGLKSLPSTPITITNLNNPNQELITGFTAIADRVNKNITLSWKKMPEEVVEIIIYKSKKDGKPVLWKQLPPVTNKLVDQSVSPNNTYTYQLRVVLKNSAYSKIKSVNVTY